MIKTNKKEKEAGHFAVGTVRPKLEGFSGKFILAHRKSDNKVLLFADASAQTHFAIQTVYLTNGPKYEVLGGGMLDVFKDRNELIANIYDSSTDFGPVPYDMTAVCLSSKFRGITFKFGPELADSTKFIQEKLRGIRGGIEPLITEIKLAVQRLKVKK